MLSLCRTMISSDEAAISSRIGAVVRSGRAEPPHEQRKCRRRNHAAQRNVARQCNDDHEQHESDNSMARGASAANAPTAVATPLPPLKRSQTVNMCPRMAQKAASAASRKTVRLSITCDV